MKKAVIFDMYETLITHYNCPLYFSEEMSQDAKVPVEKFLPIWRGTQEDRWVGKLTFEDTITRIMEENHCYSKENLDTIVKKRMETKEEGFRHLHEEILPLLKKLKEKKIKIGLISNCFSEEVIAIRNSILFPYFDEVCLSYEEGVQKPDLKIYTNCLKKLDVEAKDCLYVGDGGCEELESAAKIGMQPLQATWYFQDWIKYQTRRKPGFIQLDSPLQVLDYLE